MSPLLTASLIIIGISILIAFLVLWIFTRNKNRQRELLSDDTPPGGITPDGQLIFHTNVLITTLYILLLAIGTATVLYGALL